MPKDVKVTVGTNQGLSLVVFNSGSTTAVVRTLIGKFPTVEQMYRTDAKSKWKFDRQDLIECSDEVDMLVEVRNKGITVKVDGNDNIRSLLSPTQLR